MNPLFAAIVLLLIVAAALFVIVPLWQGLQKWRAIALCAALAAFTVGLYARLGRPDAVSGDALPHVADDAAVPVRSEAPTSQQIEAMVQRLAQRLEASPDDPQGWRMLAKSYETLGRFDQAVAAYRRLVAMAPGDPHVLTDFAVTLGMAKGQTLAGEPEALIDQALRIDPRDVQALALSGSAAYEHQRYGRAVAQWEKLLAVVPPDAEIRASIERNVEKARALQKGTR